MHYCKLYVLLPLLILLSACNSNDRINELLCRAEYHYNTLGADAAIATVREIDNKHEYVIDSNVARFLILRGAKDQRVEDFDHANLILNSMKSPPDDPGRISARYISILRFLAIANGSDNSDARQELIQYCSESAVSETECLHANMMEMFDILAVNDGTKNKSFRDFAHLFNRTYHAEFSDPSLDVMLDYSRSVVTSCGTHE